MRMPDVPGDLMVDLGLNVWSEEPDSLDQGAWPSKSVSLYFVKRKALSNKLSFIYGLGLGLDKIALGDTHTLFSDKDSAYVSNIPLSSVKKNKLASTYIDVPLEIRLHPKGTQEGEGFFLGIGGIAGIMLNAHTRWKYDQGGENVVQKTSGRFDLSTFRYGAQVRLGFKGVHFFYKQYFNNTFRNPVATYDANGNVANGQAFNPTMTTIGINVTGF